MKDLIFSVKVHRTEKTSRNKTLSDYTFDFSISEIFAAEEELFFCLSEIINRLIIDNYIKISDKLLSLDKEKQLEIVQEKRELLFDKIRKNEINIEYANSSETTNEILKEITEWTICPL